MIDPNIVAIVRRAQGGDEAAFHALVERCDGLAFATSLAWLRDPEAARDATQEAFAEVWLRLPQLRDAEAFWSWFRRVLYKHCDRQWRRRRLAVVPLEHAGDVPDRGSSPESLAERAELDAALRKALEGVGDTYRPVLALQYIGDCSLPQIAEYLDLPLSTVKRRSRVGRKRLRKELTSMADERREERDLETLPDEVRLFAAIRAGDIAAVQRLLARRPELASIEEDWSEAEALDFGLPWANHGTPLIRAAERGELAMVNALLEAGAEVDQACGCAAGESALWAAVVGGYASVAERLLTLGASSQHEAFGRTPLHAAAIRGRPQLVGTLLRHGVDVDARDRTGRTAIEWAAELGHGEVVAVLDPTVKGRAARAGSAQQRAAHAGEVLATGVKAIDLFAPLVTGARMRWPLRYGAGDVVLMLEIARSLLATYDALPCWIGFEQGHLLTSSDLAHAVAESGFEPHEGQVDLVRADLSAAERGASFSAVCGRVLRRAGETGRPLVLFVVEAEGNRADVEAILPNLTIENGVLISFVTSAGRGGADREYEDQQDLDGRIILDPRLANRGYYPAVHPLLSYSRALHEGLLGERHRVTAVAARDLLSAYRKHDDDLSMLPSAKDGDDPHAGGWTVDHGLERAQRLHAFFTQPFGVAEPFTGLRGVAVPVDETIGGAESILRGDQDEVAISELLWQGSLGDGDRSY